MYYQYTHLTINNYNICPSQNKSILNRINDKVYFLLINSWQKKPNTFFTPIDVSSILNYGYIKNT